MASIGNDNMVRLWDVTAHRERALWSIRPEVHSLAFSPDAKLLAAGNGFASHIKLWDLDNMQEFAQLLGHPGAIPIWLAFSPDGRTLASASGDGSLIFWNTATRQQMLMIQTAFAGPIAFSPDGRTLASGSGGPEALIWLWPMPAPAK